MCLLLFSFFFFFFLIGVSHFVVRPVEENECFVLELFLFLYSILRPLNVLVELSFFVSVDIVKHCEAWTKLPVASMLCAGNGWLLFAGRQQSVDLYLSPAATTIIIQPSHAR